MALPCCKNVTIPRHKSLTPEHFVQHYLKKGLPVVIEGATEDWPARNWTLDSLRERVGGNQVYVRSNTSCQDYKLGRKYNIRQTTFKQYVDDLLAGNARGRNSYLAVQNIKKAFPQIEAEAPIPAYIGKIHAGPFLWIAREGHYEYCHFDPDDGMLVMLQGRKQVRLFGCQLPPLYPNPLGSKGRTIQASVDCDNPNLESHPLFATATCHHALLEAGDMLYIPAFWWHQVTSLDVAISVNMFWGDAGTNTYLTKVMESDPWPAFSHWLLNIIEQNHECQSFQRVLSRLRDSLYHFLITQWHEYASDKQLDTLVQLIKSHLQLDELPAPATMGKNPPQLQIRGLLWRS